MLAYTSRYFNVIAPLVRHLLQRRYGYDLAKCAYDGARGIYRQMLADCPPVGADNPMAKNLYEACVFFAMYRAADGAITPDMLRAVVADLFALPATGLVGLAVDLNRPRDVAAFNERLRANARWADEHPEAKPYTWDFNFGDTRGDTQVNYHFTHCPINDFCRAHGLLDVLPVMCEIDHVTARLAHGTLTREHTLAMGGPVCDYLIRGDRVGADGGAADAGVADEAAAAAGVVAGAAEAHGEGSFRKLGSIVGRTLGKQPNAERLNIDYSRHVEYLPTTKAVLRARLEARLGPERADEAWARAVRLYEDWCAELPYTGGGRNLQAHALYDSIICFAYWEALPEGERETVDEFAETVGLVYNGAQGKVRRNPELLTMNNEPLARVAGCAIRLAFDVAVNRHVRAGEWGNAWEVRINDPAVEGVPIRAQLIGCPVVDFARAHGYEHLLPGMCNPDFDGMKSIGAHLIRPHTVAMGYPDCESMVVGDRTELAAATPPHLDENGFLVNDLPS